MKHRVSFTFAFLVGMAAGALCELRSWPPRTSTCNPTSHPDRRSPTGECDAAERLAPEVAWTVERPKASITYFSAPSRETRHRSR